MIRYLCILVFSFSFASCSPDETPNQVNGDYYFPPLGSSVWESTAPLDLGWDIAALDDLKQNLEVNGTRAFIVLHKGKIVVEEYFGRRLVGGQAFEQSSNWYWASAGKTLTAVLMGLAQEDGFLILDDPSSAYLGAGWTSLDPIQEQKITLWHQLTMTTGLEDAVSDRDDYTPDNLVYKAEPGSRWAYHNAPYTLLEQVVAAASGKPFGLYFQEVLGSKIGMAGTWQKIGFNNVYFSDARSMARFGLLILAEGDWDGTSVVRDKNFFKDMVTSSQIINRSYGYLWWLNGKGNFMVPGLQVQFSGSWASDAPSDMVCGLGRDGQYVCVVPSLDLVVVRMGESPEDSLVPFTYLNTIWSQLSKILP